MPKFNPTSDAVNHASLPVPVQTKPHPMPENSPDIRLAWPFRSTKVIQPPPVTLPSMTAAIDPSGDTRTVDTDPGPLVHLRAQRKLEPGMAWPIGAHCDERAAVRQPIGRHT